MHVAFRSSTIRGAITAADIVEGLAVTLTNSGTVNGFQTDLPNVALADSGVTRVYVLEAAPDNFPRPVDRRQYRAGWYVHLDRDEADFNEPLETITRYNIGIANLYNPTVPSGFLVLAHRGGTYTVPSDCFVESANIKIPGNYVEVGDGGKWQYTASESSAVGEVVRYDDSTDELTFSLWP